MPYKGFPTPCTSGHSTADLAGQLHFPGIDDHARAAFRDFRPVVEAELPGILDRFYARTRGWPNLMALFGGETGVRHAREHQLRHWLEIP